MRDAKSIMLMMIDPALISGQSKAMHVPCATCRQAVYIQGRRVAGEGGWILRRKPRRELCLRLTDAMPCTEVEMMAILCLVVQS